MRRATPLAIALVLAITAGPAAPSPAAATSGSAIAAPRVGGTDAPAASVEAPAVDEDVAAADPAPLTAAGRFIVILKDGRSVDRVAGRAGRFGVHADRTFRHAVHGFSARLTPGQLAALHSDPDVEAVARAGGETAAAGGVARNHLE